jgi:MFS transporter, SP family, solute carrier family 2 (myo-inositol transporter), member 13
VFLPVVGSFGYAAIFFFWAACSLLYYLTATFWLPETKGKSLEEIEMYFEGPREAAGSSAL